jgi:hypothetical protein
VSDTPRRDFLAQLAAAGLATAGLSTLGCAAHAQAAPGIGGAGAPKFDDSWTERVRAARHKAVFDAPEVQEGLGIWQAWLFRHGYQEAMGAAEAQAALPVVVLRHRATVLAVDDALWAKYKIGAARKIDDPATEKPAVRNPYARPRPDAPAPAPRMARILGGEPEPTVEGLIKAGAVVLVCNLALGQIVADVARQSGQSEDQARAEVVAALIPGAILQPSGVYAVLRAQEAGCVYLRSTNVA